MCAELALLLNDNPRTCFPRATEAAELLGCVPHFEKEARKRRFECWQDWLLCRLWPEYTKPCRAYYRGDGVQFKAMMKGKVRKTDAIMARCIRESYYKAKENHV